MCAVSSGSNASTYGFLLYDHFSPENPRNDGVLKKADYHRDARSTRRFTHGRLKQLGSREESFSFLEARPLREDYSLRLLSAYSVALAARAILSPRPPAGVRKAAFALR